MFDGELMFSNRQAVSATAVSTNILKVDRDIGAGTPLYLEVDAPAAAGSGSLTVEVSTGDLEDMSDKKTLASFPIGNAALLRGGTVLCAPIPARTGKYLQANYIVNGTVTGLTVTTGVTTSRQTAPPQGR